MKVFLTTQAHLDIAEIKAHIAENNPAVAERVAKRLYDTAGSLARNPQKGIALSAKFEIETDLRMLIVSPLIDTTVRVR